MTPRISLVVPAHNEEAFLPACLESARRAIESAGCEVEIIVVLNRCTDATEAIALSHGCGIAREDAKNLSKIRNAGVQASTGEVVVTCDADSRMHRDTFTEVLDRLASGKVVGGGAIVLPERWSAGIVASVLAIAPYLAFSGVSFGLFWCRRRDFEEIGGFNEQLVSVEDLDFARRLKAHGRRSGRRWGTLFRSPLITSCRKFDQFGDWYLFRNPAFVRKIFKGTDRKVADSFWYDARSK